MICLISNNFVHSSKIKDYSILFNGDSTSTKKNSLCYFETQVFIRRTISISSSSNNNNNNSINPNSSSFTVFYLINSCGLTEENAIPASKKIQFEDPTNPDLVLTLLRNYGIPNPHISKIIQKLPKLLLSNPDKTLKPKLHFFCSLDQSGPHLAKLLSGNPYIFNVSLENKIIPLVDTFKRILGTNIDVVSLLKCTLVFGSQTQDIVVPNISLLQSHGVPDSHIVNLLVSQPRVFWKTSHKFKELVEEVINMGFDPSKSTFLRAVQGLGSMSKSTREAKFDLFKKWGWSEEDIYRAFRLEPTCWLLSETNIMHKMDFFVNKMCYNPLLIASFPGVLCFSMEKRILPRFSVIELLSSNGLIQKDFKIKSMLHISEKEFLKKFVTKYEKKVPHLMNAYQREKNENVVTSMSSSTTGTVGLTI